MNTKKAQTAHPPSTIAVFRLQLGGLQYLPWRKDVSSPSLLVQIVLWCGSGGFGTAPRAPAGRYPQGLLHRLTTRHLPNPTRDRSSIVAHQPPAGVQTHLGYGICGPAPMTTATCSRAHVR